MPSLIMPLIIANIALCGIPFIAGFYSKDQILEFMIFNQINFRFITLFILGTLLTSIYTLRFLSRTILAENLSLPMNISTDTNKRTTYATIILSTGAVVRGSALNWLILIPIKRNLIPLSCKLMPLILIIFAFVLVYFIIKTKKRSLINLTSLNEINTSIWFISNISTQILINPSMIWGNRSLKILDHGWNEIYGGKGAFKIIKRMRKTLMNLNFASLSQRLIIILIRINVFTFII